jgi:cystathionine beta-lyase/cystathionine gamma-synthase
MTYDSQDDLTAILHHQGERELPFGAVSPPIFQTSIFCYKSYEDFRDALADESKSYLYTRGNNPTVNLAEQKIAALEKGERAKLVSSGVAAMTLAVSAFLQAGDHIVAVEDSYTWTRHLADVYLKRFGIDCTFVEGCRMEDFEEAVRPETKIIILESPTTFTFKLQNLKEIGAFARSRGIRTIIDNTWATPLFQNPLEMGIDLVTHSVSKYLGGNSDVVGGVIVGSDEDVKRIFNDEFLVNGPVPDPMLAWLVMRSMRTMHIRMPVHFENAKKLCAYLESHPKVESVLYPFLESYPQYDLACEQMRGGSGLFSFRLKSRDLEDVKAFTNALGFFKRAVSWGGYESLVFPAAVKWADNDDIPGDRISLIRCHAGLEESDLLLKDLEQALGKVKG